MTALVLALMGFASVFLATRFLRDEDRKVKSRIASMVDPSVVADHRKPKLVRWVENLGRRLPGPRDLIKAQISRAGIEMSPDFVIGMRAVLMVAAFIGLLRLGRLGVFLSPAAAFGAYRLPELLIAARVKVRRDELASHLPDAVDLLAVTTQAGLNVALSLKRVAERVTGPLGDEFRTTLREVDLGVARRDALMAMAARNQVDDLDALVAALANAERFGTQVSASLAELSNEIRAKRRRRAEEQARRAPIKILFPLVFLILPAFVLLTVVPLLLGTLRTLGF
ncbi:MAG TPA: type II secretion system F family protein [Actinomycetota bacterium]|nr:type II secretion system F family protein [Actinomycetota bacterium]